MAQTVCVLLNALDRMRLEAIATDRNQPRKHVERARVVLSSANGRPVQQVATEVDVSRPMGTERSEMPAALAIARPVQCVCHAGRHETPQLDQQLARHCDDQRLPYALTRISGTRAVPLREGAFLLKHQEPPCQLDHAAPYSGVAGSCQSLFPASGTAFVGCPGQTGIPRHSSSIAQIA